MRTLEEYINEAMGPGAGSPKDIIKNHLKRCYQGGKFKISPKPNSEGLYEVVITGDVTFTAAYPDPNFTNGKYVITELKGDLIVKEGTHAQITTLAGLPKKITGKLVLDNINAESFDGISEEVGSLIIRGGNFKNFSELSNCNILNDLYIGGTSWTTIGDLPKTINGNFTLKSNMWLNGYENALPKTVKGDCTIQGNGKKKYNEAAIRKLIDVKGSVTADK